MSSKDVAITLGDVSPTIDPSRIAFASSELVYNLIHDQASAVAFLAEGLSPITVDNIDIDSLGRVIVDDLNFANAVRDQANAEGISLNYKCTIKK